MGVFPLAPAVLDRLQTACRPHAGGANEAPADMYSRLNFPNSHLLLLSCASHLRHAACGPKRRQPVSLAQWATEPCYPHLTGVYT